MRVLFVTASLGWTDSAAVASLSAVAAARGHECWYRYLDHKDRVFPSSVSMFKPDVIAYSTDATGWRACCEANQEARGWGRFVAIMGGPQPTQDPGSFAESGMDAYCAGEGEGAFADFLDRVSAGASFGGVPNLITAKGENPHVRPLIACLDSLPMPDRDLVLSSTFLRDTPKKTFFTSRGCPFQCSYCQNDNLRELYRGLGPYVRRFSVDRVLREMESVRSKYRMDFVKIDDDCFAIRADAWLEDFCREYKRRIGLPFNCLLRFDHVDDDLLALLRSAGCYSVHLSVDSTCPQVRERILNRRQAGDVDIAARLRQIRRHGIHTWVNYMVAVPTSTVWDDLATIQMSKRGNVTYASYTTTTPMKGTKLYAYCREHGLLPEAYAQDMAEAFYKPSTLRCFSPWRKMVSQNVLLLAAVVAKLPWPLDRLATVLLMVLPNLSLFSTIRRWAYTWAVEKSIYKLRGGA